MKSKSDIAGNLPVRFQRRIVGEYGYPGLAALAVPVASGYDNHYFILLVDVADYGKIQSGEASEASLHKALCILLEEAWAEQRDTPYRLVLTPAGHSIVGLLCARQTDLPADPADPGLLLEPLLNMMSTRFGVSLSISAGGLHDNLSCFHSAFSEALIARELQVGPPVGRTISCYSDAMLQTHEFWLDFSIGDLERQLYTYMMRGVPAKAYQATAAILAHCRKRAGLSMPVIRCRLFRLLNMVLDGLQPLSLDNDQPDQMPVQVGALEKILTARTMGELENIVLMAIDMIGKSHGRNLSHAGGKVHEIEKYVHSHFDDENLCLQQIADEFNLSVQYLSRIFKQATGVGLLDYINRCRVDKAKLLLQASMFDEIRQLARQTGFSCSQSFIRTFKRYEGITPGEYRKKKARQIRSEYGG